MGQVPVVGKPLGGMLRMFGLGTKPTEGTTFRRELGSVFNQVPVLKGTDLTKYNIDPAAYNAFSPQVKDSAQKLGEILAAYAPEGKADPKAYAIQAQNILLNRFGAQTPDILNQLLPILRGQQAGATTTAGAAPTAAGGGLASMIKGLTQKMV